MGELRNRRREQYRKKRQRNLMLISISAIVVSAVIIAGFFLFAGENLKNGISNTGISNDKVSNDKVSDKNTQQNETMDSQIVDQDNLNPDTTNPENTNSEYANLEGVDSESTDSEISDSKIQDVTMFFTGDVMLQKCTGIYDEQGIHGILSEYLVQEMTSADITMINNEFPFSTRGTQHPDKQYTFRVDPVYVSILKDMGVDAASLANNHALDYGTEALMDTFTTLDDAGIPYVGAGATKERAEEAVFVETGGRTIGILSASRVIPVIEWNIENRQPGLFCTYDSSRLVQRIQEIENQCDYVVVFVHWGVEKKTYPEEYQRNLAKQYIDAGADLVVGNHAHVPQGIEFYKDVPIVYCLGNFVFNSTMKDTYVLKVHWNAEGNTSLQVIPVGIKNYYTSELPQEAAQTFYKYLEEISFDAAIDENGMVTKQIANGIK